mmetsp:Transcript_101636/g.296308  ORF Transcript_101636/g.296308 Transcript_101636/m.296308 type:complete len:282 (+) Transcript_101636:96-941(+)
MPLHALLQQNLAASSVPRGSLQHAPPNGRGNHQAEPGWKPTRQTPNGLDALKQVLVHLGRSISRPCLSYPTKPNAATAAASAAGRLRGPRCLRADSAQAAPGSVCFAPACGFLGAGAGATSSTHGSDFGPEARQLLPHAGQLTAHGRELQCDTSGTRRPRHGRRRRRHPGSGPCLVAGREPGVQLPGFAVWPHHVPRVGTVGEAEHMADLVQEHREERHGLRQMLGSFLAPQKPALCRIEPHALARGLSQLAAGPRHAAGQALAQGRQVVKLHAQTRPDTA